MLTVVPPPSLIGLSVGQASVQSMQALEFSHDGRWLLVKTTFIDDIAPTVLRQAVSLFDVQTQSHVRTYNPLLGSGDTVDIRQAALAMVGQEAVVVMAYSAQGVDGGAASRLAWFRDGNRLSDDLLGPLVPGGRANAAMDALALSQDGRFLALSTSASNIVAGLDTNEVSDVYLVDLHGPAVRRVSVLADDTEPDQPVSLGDVRTLPDGSIAVSFSTASNLLASADDNASSDVLVWRANAVNAPATLTLHSQNSQGKSAAGPSTGSVLTDLGIYFQSSAPDLVAGDSNGVADVFLRTWAGTAAARVSQISGAAGGTGELDGASDIGGSSASGRYVVFRSDAPKLGAQLGVEQIFVADRATGALVAVSKSSAAALGDEASLYPTISGNGLRLALTTLASNLAESAGSDSALRLLVGTNPLFVNSPASGTLSITGPSVQGGVLVVSNMLSDADGIPTSGPGAFTYQWNANGVAISGATGTGYILTQAELGKNITVTARYTDNAGTAESVTTGQTAAVSPPPIALQGIVYHWKSHSLLSGVNVAAGPASSAPGNAGDLFDLRAAMFDAATGALTLQVWTKSSAVFENFDFTVNGQGAAGVSFTSALPASWTVQTSSPAAQSIKVAGISTAALLGSIQLGTLQIAMPANTEAAQLGFSNIQVGAGSGPNQGISIQARTTGANGSFSFTNLDRTELQLVVSRAVGEGADSNAITSADALAALRIAVGLNPNLDPDGPTGPKSKPAVSPYQIMAADVNGTGTVTSADALAILRMAVKLSTALPQEWFFVEEKRDFWDEANQKFTLSRMNASWDRTILADPAGGTVNLVAVLKGDVNGSWQAPAGSQSLHDLDPTYFDRLAALIGVPNQDQWGGGP